MKIEQGKFQGKVSEEGNLTKVIVAEIAYSQDPENPELIIEENTVQDKQDEEVNDK